MTLQAEISKEWHIGRGTKMLYISLLKGYGWNKAIWLLTNKATQLPAGDADCVLSETSDIKLKEG